MLPVRCRSETARAPPQEQGQLHRCSPPHLHLSVRTGPELQLRVRQCSVAPVASKASLRPFSRSATVPVYKPTVHMMAIHHSRQAIDHHDRP